MSASSEGLGPSLSALDPETVLVTRDPCPDCGEGLVALLDHPALGLAGAYDLVCTNCPYEQYVPKETTARTRIAAVRAIANGGNAERVDGILVDRITAGLLVAVYEALSPANRERFGKPPLERLVALGWKHARPA